MSIIAPSQDTQAQSHAEAGKDAAATDDVAAILDRIRSFLSRFIFLKNPALYMLLAVWTLATYLVDTFEYTGYILIHSPEPESGKSTVLCVLDGLVSNSSGVLVSPTEAVIFRTAHDPTQLLDEVDAWTNREIFRGVLNAGFQRNGKAPRMILDAKRNYTPQMFPVYAPRTLAGIGRELLHKTTRDRTFAIEIVRQKKSEKREPFRSRKLQPALDALRKQIKEWADQNRQPVADAYDRADFPYLDQFRDRTVDISQPLAAVLEVVYARDARLVEMRRILVEAIAISRNDQVEVVQEHAILRKLLDLTALEDPLVGNATELAAKCSNQLERVVDSEVSEVLRHYGFTTKSIRKDGGSKYRYSLSHEALAEVLARYDRSSQTEGSDGKKDQPTTGQT